MIANILIGHWPSAFGRAASTNQILEEDRLGRLLSRTVATTESGDVSVRVNEVVGADEDGVVLGKSLGRWGWDVSYPFDDTEV